MKIIYKNTTGSMVVITGQIPGRLCILMVCVASLQFPLLVQGQRFVGYANW